jgi:peptidyl-dipeptidase A
VVWVHGNFATLARWFGLAYAVVGFRLGGALARSLSIARACLWVSLTACGRADDGGSLHERTLRLLAAWDEAVVPRYSAWQQAEWEAHTHVREGDESFADQAAEARLAWEREVGRSDWGASARELLGNVAMQREGTVRGEALEPALTAAVETIRQFARQNAEVAGEARRRRDVAVGVHLRTRDRALPRMDGQVIDLDQLTDQYRSAVAAGERATLWGAVLSDARDLKPTFMRMRDALNAHAAKAGWENHHAAAIAEFGLRPTEVDAWLNDVEVALRPLYRELHTYVRYELATKYTPGEAAPEYLPAHWIDDPLGMDWTGIVGGLPPDPSGGLETRRADGMLQDANRLFLETGWSDVPEAFWTRSSLYPTPLDARFDKTPGASTWDLDLQGDVRLLMSTFPSEAWMHAAYREAGYAHAFLERHRAGVPAALRVGTPDPLLGAVSQWADLLGTRTARLRRLGIVDGTAVAPTIPHPDLSEALSVIPFLMGGVSAAAFERDVYASGLSADQLTSRWWEIVREHQAIVPPETRTERWADPLHLPALTDMPGRYGEFVFGVVVAWQMHLLTSEKLGVDPRDVDAGKNPGYGDTMRQLAARAGAGSVRDVVVEVAGEPPSAERLATHFEPLRAWLAEQNHGRVSPIVRR